MLSMCSPWFNRLMRLLTFSSVVFTIGALRRSYCSLLSSCTLASYIFSALFIAVVVPLFVFLRFIAGLFCNFFRALTSLRDKLFLCLIILISASRVLTFPSSSQGQQSVERGASKLIYHEKDVVLCFAREKYIGVSSALRIVQNLATVVA